MLSVVLLVQAAMSCEYGTGCPFWLGNVETPSSKLLSSNHLLEICECRYTYIICFPRISLLIDLLISFTQTHTQICMY